MTTCARCGQEIEYVANSRRGYWSATTTGAVCDGLQFHHTPPPEYYKKERA